MREAAPVGFDRLDEIHGRLVGDDRFDAVELQPAYAPNRLVCHFDDAYYPPTVPAVRLEMVWFENDDFSIQYHETHESGAFDHRWGRHPSDHNDRDHVHPGPDAPSPGTDVDHPTDWRDVLADVLAAVDARMRAFWEQ